MLITDETPDGGKFRFTTNDWRLDRSHRSRLRVGDTDAQSNASGQTLLQKPCLGQR